MLEKIEDRLKFVPKINSQEFNIVTPDKHPMERMIYHFQAIGKSNLKVLKTNHQIQNHIASLTQTMVELDDMSHQIQKIVFDIKIEMSTPSTIQHELPLMLIDIEQLFVQTNAKVNTVNSLTKEIAKYVSSNLDLKNVENQETIDIYKKVILDRYSQVETILQTNQEIQYTIEQIYDLMATLNTQQPALSTVS